MPTIEELLRARAGDPGTALRFEDQTWSYAEYVDACAERAAYLLESRREGPFHLGVLLDNVPEFAMWLGAGALAGAAIVGINPTRRGAELARDVTHTQCQLLLTDSHYRALLEGLELGIEERPRSRDRLHQLRRGAQTPPRRAAPRDRDQREHALPADLHLRHRRRAQGLPLFAGETGDDRTDPGADAAALGERRLLSGDADVPLERVDGRLGARPLRGGHLRPAAEVLGVGLSQRRAPLRSDLLQLRRQAAGLHPGNPGAAR